MTKQNTIDSGPPPDDILIILIYLNNTKIFGKINRSDKFILDAHEGGHINDTETKHGAHFPAQKA